MQRRRLRTDGAGLPGFAGAVEGAAVRVSAEVEMIDALGVNHQQLQVVGDGGFDRDTPGVPIRIEHRSA